MKVLIEGPLHTAWVEEEIQKHKESKTSGAHALFLGQVRADVTNGKKVKEIVYSAYESMVFQEAEKIKQTIFSKYKDVTDVKILHSTGTVKAGEVSLFVYVGAGHRKACFPALEETVELIKKHLPVWKKEICEDGSYEWKE